MLHIPPIQRRCLSSTVTVSRPIKLRSCALTSHAGGIIEVGVVGAVIPPDGASVLPISSYSINGTSPSIYVTPDNYTQATTGIVFFASQPLSNGPHALVISLTQASDTYPFLMDYVIVRVINGTIPFPSTSNSASPTSPVASESATSGATAAPASSAVSSKSSSTPTDAIVGGVVGGVVALVAAALLLFFLRHRRKRRTHFDYPDLLDSGLDPGLCDLLIHVLNVNAQFRLTSVCSHAIYCLTRSVKFSCP